MNEELPATWSRERMIFFLTQCVYPKHRGRYAQMFEARLRELPDQNLRYMVENALEEAQAKEVRRLERHRAMLARIQNGAPR